MGSTSSGEYFDFARSNVNGATILVVGLGDLGSRVLDGLAYEPDVARVIGAGRNAEHGEALTGQAALSAALLDGAEDVGFRQLDLRDPDAAVRVLREVQPDVVVMAASLHTWWRVPSSDPLRAAELASLPYGAWIPLHVPLVRSLMEAHRAAGLDGVVICLPYPDAVGPVLAAHDLAPHMGAGNVTEVAAKLQVLASQKYGVSRSAIQVRLVMHHAVERVAFAAFAVLSGETAAGHGEPPWCAEVRVHGEPLSQNEVSDLLCRPYALLPGVATHDLTAIATIHLVRALLSTEPVHTHAPSPSGLPGGYPVVLAGGQVALDLPPDLSEDDAVRLNEEAARWDGIERIESDGTVVFTSEVAEISERVLGLRLERSAVSDVDDLAAEMVARSGH